jgi:CubicO group peptidase (beta-lactamase class C family)
VEESELAAWLSVQLAQTLTPGVAIGLLRGAEQSVVTVGSRGEGSGPVGEDTLFAAASLTKPVFAAGVMALTDDGILELDVPLSEYLAEPYVHSDERAVSITARMVLSHTTGLPNWRQGSNDRVHPKDGALRLRWPPGSRWGYSGEGFSYLQQVVEHLVDAPIAEYMAVALLQPLGMTSSTFTWPAVDDPRLAVGHTDTGEAMPRFRPPFEKASAGGLYTTASDYLRFLKHCLVHEQRMFVPQAHIDDELGWALGWGIELGEDNAVWQWGNDPGYKNFVLGTPAEHSGIVVFTNGERGAEVYSKVVREVLPGNHPSLDANRRPGWQRSWQTTD